MPNSPKLSKVVQFYMELKTASSGIYNAARPEVLSHTNDNSIVCSVVLKHGPAGLD